MRPNQPEETLFAPTVADTQRPGAMQRPWRLDSQFWVAFFGGPIAGGAIAYLNARRLGIRDRRLGVIVVAALAGLGAACAIAYGFAAADLGAGARLATQMGGVLSYAPFYRLQRSADRIYTFYGDGGEEEAYDSLWGPGLVSVFVAGIPSVALVGGVVTEIAG